MTITQQALAAMQPPPGAPASAWALRISACWQASVKAILEVGRLLSEAKQALPHGEFGSMCESALPFTARTAQMLMAIAADPRLTNPKHVSLLPPHWGTLYELTKLTDEQFDAGVKDGTIIPDLDRQAAVRAARAIAPGRQQPSASLDFSPTPPWGTRALIRHVLPQLNMEIRFDAPVWEPACGAGHMAEVLREYFSDVFASDIHDYGYGDALIDFTSDEPQGVDPMPDWIITNPPFNKASDFALRAIARARLGVALFTRWQWIEGVNRFNDLFNPFPPALVCPFVERIPLHMGRWEPDGDTLTAYCWIVWCRNYTPNITQTRLFWIPPGCRKDCSRADDAERFTVHPVIRKDRVLKVADDGSPTDHNTGEIQEPEARRDSDDFPEFCRVENRGKPLSEFRESK